MDLLVVVPAVRHLAQRSREVPSLDLRGHREPDLAGRVRRDRRVRIRDRREDVLRRVAQLADEREVQPEAFSLTAAVSTRSEGVRDELEVRLLEEGGGGTDGVGRVGDDGIVCAGVFCEELEAVANVYSDARIREQRSHVRKILLGDSHNGLCTYCEFCFLYTRSRTHFINVAKDYSLDRVVLQDLPNDASVTSTDDKDFFRVGMARKREVCDHFLVAIWINKLNSRSEVHMHKCTHENSSRSVH